MERPGKVKLGPPTRGLLKISGVGAAETAQERFLFDKHKNVHDPEKDKGVKKNAGGPDKKSAPQEKKNGPYDHGIAHEPIRPRDNKALRMRIRQGRPLPFADKKHNAPNRKNVPKNRKTAAQPSAYGHLEGSEERVYAPTDKKWKKGP